MTKTSPESEVSEGKPIIKSPELKGKKYKISKSRVALSSKNTVQVTYNFKCSDGHTKKKRWN